MTEEQQIPVPEVMRQLIQHQNDILNRTQQQLFNELGDANAELMKIMGLNPNEGWKLDISKLAYVREVTTEPTVEQINDTIL